MKGTRTHIDVGGVLHTGRELSVREALTIPEFASFRFPEPAVASLAIRRVGRGLELQGSVDVEAAGECGRCLEEVRLPVHLDVDESFEPSSERGDPLAESNVLSGDDLDLGDLVRQLIDAALPYVALCDERCQGLCPRCGQKRDGSSCCPQSE